MILRLGHVQLPSIFRSNVAGYRNIFAQRISLNLRKERVVWWEVRKVPKIYAELSRVGVNSRPRNVIGLSFKKSLAAGWSGEVDGLDQRYRECKE